MARELQPEGVHVAHVVIDGPVITSRGPGTAMDFALAVIEKLLGYSARRKVEVPLQRASR